MSIYAEVVADSIFRDARVTTLEVQMHRFVLSEFNTHRAFSRNSASSRAIPFRKQIQRIHDLGVAYPLRFASEKPGMSGGEEVEELDRAINAWDAACDASIEEAVKLHELGVHKSIVNRLLEPFMWHKVIVTATAFDNFFDLRISEQAQPEIRRVAETMRDAIEASEPVNRDTGTDDNDRTQWHLPYVPEDERFEPTLSLSALKQMSAARCARVSYLNHDGTFDVEADIRLYEKLTTNGHWSPLEHVCRPFNDETDLIVSNFYNWTQLRHIIEWPEAFKVNS